LTVTHFTPAFYHKKGLSTTDNYTVFVEVGDIKKLSCVLGAFENISNKNLMKNFYKKYPAFF